MNPKQLRALAHARLKTWAESRSLAMQSLVAEGISITERMRERAHGGSASTRPGRLTAPERKCAVHDQVLRTEQAFRALPCRARSVLGWKYLHDRSVSSWAEAHAVPGATAGRLVSRALETVGGDLAFGDQVRATSRRRLQARREAAARVRAQELAGRCFVGAAATV